MTITYHVGDAADPDLPGRLTIAHIVNDIGRFNAGFARQIATRYPRAKEQYERWARGEWSLRPLRLGAVQFVGVGREVNRGPWEGRWVANMVAQHGLRSHTNRHPLDLAALAECLGELADDDEHVIVMPRIGCGLAGGTWDEVEPLVNSILYAKDVHVYDEEDMAMVTG
jgi:O-acetyl-ADP-ribose deacetylase (regulator of RNase III)